MSRHPETLELLAKLSLSDSSLPELDKWSSFLKNLDEKMHLLENEQIETKKMFDLGYQQMHEVWQLVQQREQFIKSILDSSQDVILTLNEVGKVIDFNHTTERKFGLPKNKIAGESIFNLIKGGSLLQDFIFCFQEKNESYLDIFLSQLHERTMINLQGEEFVVSVFVSRVDISQNKVIYPFYIKDLTIEKELSSALHESQLSFMLTSKLSALGEMAGGIAHEINTPLAIIQMKSEQLTDLINKDPVNKESVQKAISTIGSTVERISKIIKGLKLFSRDGKNDPKTRSNLGKIIEDTLAFCREKFNSYGVRLECVCADEIIIECRPSEISQVLLNFLNNSFDAIQNIEDKWIKVEVIEDSDYVNISVIDCGLGIPKEIQEKMMTPFFTTKEIGKGTGLGLSISKGIVDSHNGKLNIDNSSKNTKFIIQLPKPASRVKAA